MIPSTLPHLLAQKIVERFGHVPSDELFNQVRPHLPHFRQKLAGVQEMLPHLGVEITPDGQHLFGHD